MARFTSPIAIAALCLLVSTTVTKAQTAPATEPLRTCQGNIMTLAWGAVVRDRQGPCRIAEPTRRLVAPRVVAPTVTMTCTKERSYLGGALQICNDQPRRRAPR